MPCFRSTAEDEPVAFSKSEAAVHMLDPLYGDHRIERKPQKVVYVIMAVGVSGCGRLPWVVSKDGCYVRLLWTAYASMVVGGA